MTGARNKHAWIWVAIAAISFASLSRAESGLDTARAYSNPVLHFLVKSQGASAAARTGMVRSAQRASILRDARTGAWVAFLPVCFVGLIAFSVFAPAAIRIRNPRPSAPRLAQLFQRPPPVLA